MKAKRKVLNISIEYDDRKQVIEAVRKVMNSFKLSTTNFSRETKNGCVTQWSISSDETVDYRVETINGVQCIVIPSKMNEL